MIVNRIALKRQPTILTLLIIIVIAGAYSYLTLPRESFPDITIPYVFVTTTYEGVSPSDMEELVTIPIERKLKGIADVEEIRSTSAEGISTVAVKFLPSVDIDDALQKVRDRVDQAKNDLPADLKDDPVIKEVNFSDLPVIRVVLSGDFSLRRLQRFAEDLKDKIESIQGVLDAPISGGLEREIHVEFDLDRVGAYNVPFSSLISAVTRSNVNMPGGSMDIGEGKYLVRVPEDFKHPSEIFSIVAFVRDGKPVYLRDLAVITDSHKDPLTRTRINGKTSVTIAVQKRSGENIVRVTDEVKKAVEEMRPLLPPSLGIDLTADMSNDVRLMVADLENNILSGLLLVLAVIFVFIGGQSAVFIALAIPYSMFITFILLMGSGITMNMVVLFSLILALGMLVDNGIVIVENIYRHMQEGEGRLEAATAATDEVAWPVITSTLTTLGAFFPMIFWPGIMGEFMKYLPITLIMALSASLFVALAINPVLSARYQRATIKTKRSRKDGLIIRAYLSFLTWALNHRLILVLSAFALLLASVASYGAFGRGTEFFPETEPRRAYITVKAPEGTNLDASDAIVAQVEKTAAQYEDIHYIIANVGAVGGDPFSQGGTGTHINRVVIDFKDFHEREKPSSEIVDELRTRLLKEIRGAEVQVEKEKEGPPTGPPVNLEISGKDIVVLGELAQRARKIIEQIPGIVDLKDNFVRGKPEITVRIDKEKAALFNLDTLTIATTVKSAINGAKVGVFREGKDEYDIIAKLPEKDRRSLESIKRLTISGPAGEPVPITSVADIGVSSGLGAIMRLDQKRVVTVSANVSGRLANDAIRDIEKRLVEQVEWPRGYSFRFTGEQREQEKAQAFLIKAFAATLFLIAIILITQFNSVATPLIILTSVLLSLIGVFLGLLVTDTAFGIIMTGIGVISLAGVVVNNAIVLIDYSNQLRDKGLSYRESLIKAGLVRFRPVMLTAITTILGLLPMAAGVSVDFRKLTLEVGSESSQWWGPMAVAVIFGLGVATLLTLVIVPVLCSLADDMRGRFKRPG
ncbi:MAG: AcrB/AcrD/AcrF family protein [Deltaproteobacteria bacterium CG17_big_fil_post_rev_8_21_14_2_50_51_6]|nr:MAG: AcrB/AcrD/AcrF family protein [Deltaproteobacteria bacterium CG17_big_fil_post_rev_8_21_14_2_50_51_6]